MVKISVFAPIARARVTTAAQAKAGWLTNSLDPRTKSRSMVVMSRSPVRWRAEARPLRRKCHSAAAVRRQ